MFVAQTFAARALFLHELLPQELVSCTNVCRVISEQGNVLHELLPQELVSCSNFCRTNSFLARTCTASGMVLDLGKFKPKVMQYYKNQCNPNKTHPMNQCSFSVHHARPKMIGTSWVGYVWSNFSTLLQIPVNTQPNLNHDSINTCLPKHCHDDCRETVRATQELCECTLWQKWFKVFGQAQLE